MNGLSWSWIAIEVTAAPLVGLLVALPLWLKEQPIFGNLAGTIVIFGTAFGLILREHLQIDRMVIACIDEGIPCFPHPDAFTRFAVYAFVALDAHTLTWTAYGLKASGTDDPIDTFTLTR